MLFVKRRSNEKARRIFGFPCDRQLALITRIQSRDLQCPIFCVAEHTLQLGGAAIELALQNEETKRNLQDHLAKEHLLVLELDPENSFDREVIEIHRKHELKRQEMERIAIELTKIADQENMDPRFLLATAQGMLRYLRDRRKRRNDIPYRWDRSPER